MAFNEIQVGRYNRLLQKLMSMKGGAPAPQLGGDIDAGITLESDRPEWQFLAGEFRAMGTTFKAADAANLSTVGLFNGNSTGVIGILEGVIVTSPNAAQADINIILGRL